MMTKVLIIDDDIAGSDRLKQYLGNEGYEVSVTHDGTEAMVAYRMREPDVILLNVAIPQVDGLQLIREIRESFVKTLIVVSEKGEVIDKVLGLEMGADDYVVKPYDLKELHARIKAVSRRMEKHEIGDGETVKFENIEISLQRYELRIKGKPVSLPPKELELLYFLAANYDLVFTRNQLLDKVWGFDYLGDSRTVDVHIKRLREKLNGVSQSWSLDTVWGVGYKFKIHPDKHKGM